MKKYQFVEDPGHGWLKVPTKEVAKIADKISTFSMFSEDGRFVYLEEDCDMPVFVNAVRGNKTFQQWHKEKTTTKYVGHFDRGKPPYDPEYVKKYFS